MKIIVGLGNPGHEYIRTRHNAGFIAVDALTSARSLEWETNKKLKARIAKTSDFIFVKPDTFMNNSGEAVEAILSYYKLLPKTLGIINKKDADLNTLLIVIHDDVDIELGSYKISHDSGSAGHRGVESIINHLKTKKFTRFRIGVKTPELKNIPTDKFVLQKFNRPELETIENIIDKLNDEI